MLIFNITINSSFIMFLFQVEFTPGTILCIRSSTLVLYVYVKDYTPHEVLVTYPGTRYCIVSHQAVVNNSSNFTVFYGLKNSSCEMEDLVETPLRELCVILRPRLQRGFYMVSWRKYSPYIMTKTNLKLQK